MGMVWSGDNDCVSGWSSGKYMGENGWERGLLVSFLRWGNGEDNVVSIAACFIHCYFITSIEWF